MFGFKVVRVLKDGSMWSAFATDLCAGLEYRLWETTARPDGGGPICVFDDLPRTRLWIDTCIEHWIWARKLDFRILRCIGKKSKDERIWFPRGNPEIRTVFPSLPPHTVLCDTVKPRTVV